MSEDHIDLKEFWHHQESAMPDVTQIVNAAKKYKNVHLRKLIVANVVALFTSAFIIFIWIYYQPELVITKIGIVLVLIAIGLYLFVYNQMMPLLVKVGFEMNSRQYLSQLLRLKEKQQFLQTKLISLYFVLLSAGISLYMLEYVQRMTLLAAVFSYLLLALWIGINWFYFRPVTIKKQNARIDQLILKFKEVQQQLS
ncbi:hypothetical protein FNH22_06245 [Fulvivirga sp. M361]|uniref:hypothetical protein n=1 Tax=Fulvivirga sp. M361 TaxID=2594266 RepID=UPI00117AF829|nr:hypothetical protein [Fulvivirga sp. M361]TRX60642.1 hypothetical protein FNH22_06245 [Fulvivirga sp. M361]